MKRPAYDDYVISHRKRAAEMEPTLGFAIPEVGHPYPRSSLPAQCVAAAGGEHHPERVDALEDSVRESVFAQHEEALSEDVHGIPALVVPGYAPITGAVPLEPLRRAFLQLDEEQRT
jgi:hypothetical protein